MVLESHGAGEAEGALVDYVECLPIHAESGTEIFVRRMRDDDQEHHHEFVFLTNQLDLPAATVAALYRERWRIESFLRSLKQNQRIKSFADLARRTL